MCRGELVARSRDYERLSVQSSNEYKKKFNNRVEYSFDQYNRYIPSKEYIRNKKEYVMKEEKLKSRNKNYITAKIKTKVMVNNLMKSIEKEIFKDK